MLVASLAQVKRAQQANAELKDDLRAQLANAHTATQAQLAQARDTIDDLRRRLDAATQAASQQQADLRREVAAATDAAHRHQAAAEQQAHAAASLSVRVETLTDELKARGEALADARDKAAALETALRSASSQHDALVTDAHSKAEEASSAQAEAQQAARRLARLERDLRAAEARAEAGETTANGYKTQVAAL